MRFVDRQDAIKLPPINKDTLEKVHYSLEMESFVDNERSFLGYTRCTSNALADVDRNDYVRRSMRKDAR